LLAAVAWPWRRSGCGVTASGDARWAATNARVALQDLATAPSPPVLSPCRRRSLRPFGGLHPWRPGVERHGRWIHGGGVEGAPWWPDLVDWQSSSVWRCDGFAVAARDKLARSAVRITLHAGGWLRRSRGRGGAVDAARRRRDTGGVRLAVQWLWRVKAACEEATEAAWRPCGRARRSRPGSATGRWPSWRGAVWMLVAKNSGVAASVVVLCGSDDGGGKVTCSGRNLAR
jgi:hypothetical protein